MGSKEWGLWKKNNCLKLVFQIPFMHSFSVSSCILEIITLVYIPTFNLMWKVHLLITNRAVIPKVCSADQWWSARLAEVVRESLYKSIFCPSRTTKFFQVVREPKKFGNHWNRGITSNNVGTAPQGQGLTGPGVGDWWSVGWQMSTQFSCFKLAVGIVKKIFSFKRNNLF